MNIIIVLLIVIYSLFWIPFIMQWAITIKHLQFIEATENIPAEIEDYYDKRLFDKTKNEVLRSVSIGSIVLPLIDLISYTVMIAANLPFHAWSYSVAIAEYFSYEGEFKISLITMTMGVCYSAITRMIVLIARAILQYENFLGMVKSWVSECNASLLVTNVIVSLIYYLTKKIGQQNIFVFLSVTSAIFWCIFIVLFDSHMMSQAQAISIQLEDKDLINKLGSLTERIDIPMDEIYFRFDDDSSIPNAFSYGYFIKKRIFISPHFLYCNICNGTDCGSELVKCNEFQALGGLTYQRRYTNEEVLAVISHEAGHWKKHHTELGILYIEILLALLVCWYLCKCGYIYEIFCFNDERPLILGIVLPLMFVWYPYLANTAFVFMKNPLQRHAEYSADAYSKNLGYGQELVTSLIKLHADGMQFPLADKLYSIFFMNHPSLIERINALQNST